MGFRFQRRIKVIPGLRLNLGLKSASLSAGGRYGRITSGTEGTTASADTPVTGLYYREKLATRRRRRKSGTLGGLLTFLIVAYLILYALGMI